MTHEQVASELLFPMWRCVSDDYKSKYRADAWTHFENFVRSSACAENLKAFFEKFKRLMLFDWQHQFERQVLAVLQSGQDREILRVLRTECSYIVLLTRALNNERNEQFKNRNET